MITRKRSYDSECFELAQYFLRDEPSLREGCSDLAQHIQDAIEDWIEAMKQDREGIYDQ